MSVSKEQALGVFHQRHASAIVRWFEIADSLTNCWFVRFSTIYDNPCILQPSRLVAVSKSTGEIVYDGSATDEG
ncbi:MAG: hypothetical protein DMF37_04905 [Verrucomicrobia bacterium]|nr:MAG: hypothetical protein DMF37_04905 [Verrucomicrobiota bacterium]